MQGRFKRNLPDGDYHTTQFIRYQCVAQLSHILCNTIIFSCSQPPFR